MGEGMPHYRNPFEKGRMLIQFNVVFPPNLDPAMADALSKILPPVEEPMIPDDHDEVDMNDYDPENDRQGHRGRGGHYDEDDEGPGLNHQPPHQHSDSSLAKFNLVKICLLLLSIIL